MKRIILCADDYGQNTAISQAIITLLKKNRLSATSCMTTSYYWLSHAKWLQALSLQDKPDFGLHFNLTEGKPQSDDFGLDFPPIVDLILKAYLRRLNQADIEAELHAQLDQFVAGIGREPDFIDGHQHVHQLPVIRDALFAVYEKRLRKSNCYIRNVFDKKSFLRMTKSGYSKMVFIQLCGAFAFKKELIKRQIPHNSSFAGVYDFKDAKKYSTLFPEFINQIKDNGIIMCHPGFNAEAQEDPIADSRPLEYHYFQSDAFLEDCLAGRVTLSQFNKI